MSTAKRTPKTQESLIDPYNVTGVFLGTVLGLSAVHISRLNSERVIQQNGKGQAKYDLTQVVSMYAEKKSRSGTASACFATLLPYLISNYRERVSFYNKGLSIECSELYQHPVWRIWTISSSNSHPALNQLILPRRSETAE